MAFLNTGTTQAPPPTSSDSSPHEHTPLEEYDHNFVFPLRELRSDKVLVTPFVPSLHARLYVEETNANEVDSEETFKWFSVGPHPDLSHALRYIEQMRQDRGTAFFAIYDLTGPSSQPRFAGVIKLCESDLSTLSTEIGRVILLPLFRRTHVLTHTLSLLLTYCFTPPTSSPTPGLGLRRVQWTSVPANTPSLRAALRMGFKYEGVIRNKWVYPVGKCLAEGASFVGIEELEGGGRGGAKRGEMAQDCWIAGITKADWEEVGAGGVRELVGRQMAR